MGTDAATIVEVCLALHVRRAARRISRRFDEALAPFGLDVSQFNILCVIAALEGAALTTVADVLDIAPSTLSRTLKPLKAQNMVQVFGGRGRGGLTLSLTLHGADVFNTAVGAWKSAQGYIASVLGEAQVGRSLEILEKLEHISSPETSHQPME
ncbi:MAG: winged helix-turn-helix transcriptional regulator [Rhodospirillaceae bacterium]|nr:winged helix-turn-helix transcriptional regulator [Rhodospirillaceae bacterium]